MTEKELDKEKETKEEKTEETTEATETTEVTDSPEKKDEEPLNAKTIIGKIVEGDVTNVTHFGAFVRLEIGEEGLVHISEIANEYVTSIDQFVAVGDKVKVKVLVRNDKNKLELSMKQAVVKKEEPALFLHKKSKNSGFEDRLTSFLKKSEEKQIDIRRNLKNKQGVSKKRR